jgi:hypothetical protein
MIQSPVIRINDVIIIGQVWRRRRNGRKRHTKKGRKTKGIKANEDRKKYKE